VAALYVMHHRMCLSSSDDVWVAGRDAADRLHPNFKQRHSRLDIAALSHTTDRSTIGKPLRVG
jgi:hypothetical protein